VALWALGFVRASVRARTADCGSGKGLTDAVVCQRGAVDEPREFEGECGAEDDKTHKVDVEAVEGTSTPTSRTN
jgi:hypothetical protein